MLAVVAALLLCAGHATAASTAKLADEQMEAGYKAARRGYWQEALSRFQNANQLSPGQPHILNNIAVALEATAQYDEARATYERALQLAPSNERVRRNFNLFKDFYEGQVEGDKEEGADDGEVGTDEGAPPSDADGEEGGDDEEA